MDTGTSFHDFVRQWSPGLMRTAFLLTGDSGLAEDLVQTALLQVARRWRRLDSPDRAYGYARTTVVNTHTSWRRRRRVPERLTADHHDAAAPEGDPGPTEQTAAALRALPPGMRAAVVLRYFEDLSEAETARVLGCSVGTVKSQTSRGLSRLREHLQAADPPAPTREPDASRGHR